MKTEVVLHVSARDFFNQLLASLQYDADVSMGQNISWKQLCEGDTYVKYISTKMGSRHTVKVSLRTLQIPCRLHMEFEASQGITHVEYDIADAGDGILVRYQEYLQAKSQMTHLNDQVMTFFYKHHAKKKVRCMLHQMEEFIQHNKCG